MKKYEFTGEVKKACGKELQQIRALTDLVVDGETIEAGTFGGWLECEENLSQDGNAWVFGNALVYGNARVFGNAWVCDDAWVYGNARVCDDARTFGRNFRGR